MKKREKFGRWTIILSVAAIVSIVATAYALTNTLLAGGTIASSTLFGGGPATIRMAQVTLEPGDTIPWHYHPGRAYIIVKTGTVTEELGCGGTETFSAGDAFEETTQSVHQMRNLGSTQAQLYVTVLVPAGSPTTINTGGPMCGPPVDVDSCKLDGWKNFDHPRTFVDQGDCIQFVLTGE
jgi:quercetin dioxygenase-like cupin family protein